MFGTTNIAATKEHLFAVRKFVQVKSKIVILPLTLLIHVSEGSNYSLQIQEEGCQSGECVEQSCSSGWEENDGQCYFWSQEKLFWGAAEEKCRSMGGHLASVTSQDVEDFLYQNVRNEQIDL